MSETKFTPGPWKVDPKYSRDIQAPDGLDVATCCLSILNRKVTTEEESIANAALIAAAPDMYEALEAAILEYGKPGGPWNVPSSPGTWIDKAKAAIVKARGEA